MAKTILITGAAARLGRTVAMALAADGWDIVLHFHRSGPMAETLAHAVNAIGRKVYLRPADLSKAEEAMALIPELARDGIRLDALINNAAIFEKDTVHDVTPERMERQMRINLFAPVLLAQSFAQHSEKGTIINIADGMRGWSVGPNFLSYSLSKLALENATRLLADALAPGIRVNAIAPGATLEGAHDKPDTFEKLRGLIPLKRTSEPEEVCAAVRYLLAAPSVTGQVLSLSGGMHLAY